MTAQLKREALLLSVSLDILVSSVKATAQNVLQASRALTTMLLLMSVFQEHLWLLIVKHLPAQFALRGQPALQKLSQPVLPAKQQSILLSAQHLVQLARLKVSVLLIE